MNELDIDVAAGTVSFTVPTSLYSKQALEIAAFVFDNRAEASCAASRGALEVELKARKAGASPAELEALGGEFLNELLNQEYRFLVGRFNGKISRLIVTQALLTARGGENPPPPPPVSPELEAETQKLLEEARAEIERTMPKKLPPQGPFIKPEGSHA